MASEYQKKQEERLDVMRHLTALKVNASGRLKRAIKPTEILKLSKDLIDKTQLKRLSKWLKESTQ